MSKKNRGRTALPKRKDLGETEYLLSSPKNAERLLKAMERARAGEGEPQTVVELRKSLGLDPLV